MEINVGVIGPLVSIIMQSLKTAGWLPGRFAPLANVVTAFAIAMAISWSEPNPVTIITNWGTIALATAGTYEMALKKAARADVSQATE